MSTAQVLALSGVILIGRCPRTRVRRTIDAVMGTVLVALRVRIAVRGT